MNKNKLIFAVIGLILIGLVLFFVANINKSTENKQTNSGSVGDFKIWMIGENKEGALSIVENFKKVNSKYSNTNILVETFPTFEDYELALISGITSGNAPDIFVLNNNEKDSVFISQAAGIDPKFISPNDFRKKFKGVFSDDLILAIDNNGESTEFLKGIPVGYESLGIFYNRRYIKFSDLSSLSGLNNLVANLKDKKPNLIPIGIGNGSTVRFASDIATQFIMLEDNVDSLTSASGNKSKQGLASYLLYGDIAGYNGYNSRYVELSKFGQNSVDLFSKGETLMVVGYPRLINEIAEKGFSKSFLQAAPFPHYFSGNGKTLINYNYFVINKNSDNKDLANEFLLYLSSDIGAEYFLDQFPYYLPALLSLESDKLEEKISDKYNIVLEDFYNSEYELSSFDKGIKTIYDKNIITILDNSSNYESAFSKFRNILLCKTQKVVSLENLSNKCE